MNPINALGLKVAGLTSIIIVLLVGLFTAGKYGLEKYQQEDTPSLAQQALLDTNRTDSDGDNLPDQFEPIYRTDQNNPDSDGDGVSDFDEIQQGKDPAVAGTQDASRPVVGSQITNPNTVTEHYLASLPDDIPSTDILDRPRLEAFVNLNKGELLPPLPPEFLRTSTATDKPAIETYLNSISTIQNSQLRAVTNADIESAFRLQTQQQPQRLTEISTQLQENVEILRAVEAPAEVQALHTHLLAASQSLADNVKRLQTTNTDFVNGLIGSKNIEELGPVFQDLANDVKTLEAKYGL